MIKSHYLLWFKSHGIDSDYVGFSYQEKSHKKLNSNKNYSNYVSTRFYVYFLNMRRGFKIYSFFSVLTTKPMKILSWFSWNIRSSSIFDSREGDWVCKLFVCLVLHYNFIVLNLLIIENVKPKKCPVVWSISQSQHRFTKKYSCE